MFKQSLDISQHINFSGALNFLTTIQLSQEIRSKYPSYELETMNLSLLLTFKSEISLLCAMMLCLGLRLFRISQTFKFASPPPVKSSYPFCLQSIPYIPLAWSSITQIDFPVLKSHTRPMASSPPLAISDPSG
ncbi:hypothetical protein OGAPHI_003416 [Ogataea philodendri]|uniref:Uncharacterized protein n=1 Tax=Ogataea philodendri TaxID=1378263 RepID=A0A9P8T6H1_9ASCO|nr:uncharacterized protein OGAPHI_003416 [Ogataea philodendri]KAH3666966.1 hypothetical protein OGAPHI_003416 [Ogataea philodendri]